MKLFFAYLILTGAFLVYVSPPFLLYFLIVYPIPLLYRRHFWVGVLLYVFAEETIVYALGGGLQGKATSLLQDYVRSIPVFLLHFGLRQQVKISMNCDEEKIFYAAGSQGIVRELIYPMNTDPLAWILFLPHAIYIYGAPMFMETRVGYKRCSIAPYRVAILVVETLLGIFLAIMFPR